MVHVRSTRGQPIGVMMSGLQFQHAKVMLFDPVRDNMRTTRFTLQQIGFVEVDSASTLAELMAGLEDKTPHLLIMETGDCEEQIFDIVRQIRYGDLTMNPFMSILLTGWKPEPRIINQSIGSGADDLMMRPFSTNFVKDRIKTLALARKPFIVTSDYTGPDRRRDTSRKSGLKPIETPNLLKSVLQDQTEEIMAHRTAVEQVNAKVQSERLRRLCMRLIIGAEAALSEMNDGHEPKVDTSEFERSAATLRKQLRHVRSTTAAKISNAVCDGAAELAKPSGLTIANFKNLKELSFAVYSAYCGGEGLERSADEIAQAAAALRKRMGSAQRQLEAKQQSSAGASQAGTLHSEAS